MPKHVIFIVHGMGDTVSGWSQPIQDLIRRKYRQYKISAIKKFDSSFAFCELNYNHVFQGHIAKWRDNAAAVNSMLEASGIDSALLTRLMDFSSKAARQDFASTHVLDVILYRFMKGLKSQVISHLSEQLVGRLNDEPRVPAYSIICHSLGTAVMHDVMQANLTTPHFPLSTAHGMPQVYMTVANVSRVLEDADTNVYTSAVRPRLADRNKPYGCNRFINVAHNLDPFTWVKTFKPAWKKGASNPLHNLKTDSYQSLKIAGLHGVNPHDLEHYLDHPSTHVALFRGLIAQGAIRENELQQQLQAHKQTTLDARLRQVKGKIEEIELGDESSLDEAIAAWADFQALVREHLQSMQ